MTRSLAKSLIVICILGIAASACVTNRTFGGGVDDVSADLSLKSRLLGDELYDYSDVDITVYEGRLLLTGTMKSEEGKAHLQGLAVSATNVDEVLNEIVVGPRTTFNQGTSDAFIDEKLGFALLADNGVYRANYQIAVSNSVIYIIGVAQGPNELTRVTDHARNIRGVERVVSHVLYVGDPKRQTRAPAQ